MVKSVGLNSLLRSWNISTFNSIIDAYSKTIVKGIIKIEIKKDDKKLNMMKREWRKKML